MNGNVGEFLKENGIKPSFQRIKIYEFLMNSKEHPTVENIYNALYSQIPTLSKTTVYNTLKIFMEKGIAMAINIDENEVHYDATTYLHGHFKCQRCNHIFDFSISLEDVTDEALENFEIIEQQVFLYGVCPSCKNKS